MAVIQKTTTALLQAGTAAALGYKSWWDAHNGFAYAALEAAAATGLAYRACQNIVSALTENTVTVNKKRIPHSRWIFEQWPKPPVDDCYRT